MCGRFYIASEDDSEELRKIIDEVNRRHQERVKSGEVFPTDIAAAITADISRPMKWGFPQYNGTGVIINARCETAHEKPMFARAVREGRCLIPASNYFEWQKTGKAKTKFSIGLGRQPIYMAGIYRYVDDAAVFAILTRDPSPVIAHIHNRMPVILPKNVHDAWLGGGNANQVYAAAIDDVVFSEAESKPQEAPETPEPEQLSFF